MLTWGSRAPQQQTIRRLKQMANVVFKQAAKQADPVVNFGDVLKVDRDGESRAYMVAVAPCTKRTRAILVNLQSGDIRGRGKKYICNIQNYSFPMAGTSWEDLEKFTRADNLTLITDATVAIQ